MMRFVVVAACVIALAQATNPVIEDDGEGLPNELTNILMEEMVVLYQQRQPWLRTAHGKQHGCVRGYLSVTDLPAELGVGPIFGNATGDSPLPLFMRFSNGAGPAFGPGGANETDTKRDGRGVSIKIFGGDRDLGPMYLPTENFMDVTWTLAPTFFLDKPETALPLFTALQSGYAAMQEFFAANPWVSYQFNNATKRVISDALAENWYTPVVHLHGPRPAKYKLTPCSGTPGPSPAGACTTFDCIREKLQADLAKDSACFLWQAQFYESAESTPIDDTTIRWNTTYYTIGKIEIPSTTKSWGDGQEALCRHMSYNDWHAPADHKPLGFVQEIRKIMYHQGALMRHALAKEPQTLTTIDDFNNYENL